MILREYASPRTRFEFNEVNSGSTFKQWSKDMLLATAVRLSCANQRVDGCHSE
jgi:hypothetical protein